MICIAGEALADLAAGMSRARATAWLRHTLLGHLLAIGPRGPAGSSPEIWSAVWSRAPTMPATRRGRGAMAAASALPAVGSLIALRSSIHGWRWRSWPGWLLLAGLLRGFVREAADVTGRYLRAQGDIAARLLDALAGARTVAAAGTEEREAGRVLTPLPDLRAHGFAMWRTQTRMTVKGAVVMPLLEVAVLATAGLLLMAGPHHPGGAAGRRALRGPRVRSRRRGAVRQPRRAGGRRLGARSRCSTGHRCRTGRRRCRLVAAGWSLGVRTVGGVPVLRASI